jgi:hypothetical protein
MLLRNVGIYLDRAVTHAVGRCFLLTEARFRDQGSPCGICGGQSGTETGFSSVLPCQYDYTAAPYSLIYHLGMDNGPVGVPVLRRHSLNSSKQQKKNIPTSPHGVTMQKTNMISSPP